MAKVSRRQQQAIFVSHSTMSQFAENAWELVAKSKGKHPWFVDYWENSTPIRGQRTSRIRIFDLPGGQEECNSIIQQLQDLAKQELPAGSWVVRTWRTGSAPMMGSWETKLKNNVFTVYYKSKHEGPHWK
jgi:hypothetical protein